MFDHDPLRISREFQALALRLAAADRARNGAASSSNPFFGRRWPGARERDALAELHPEDPVRPGLLRWVEYFWLRCTESGFDAHESQLRLGELHPPIPPFEQPVTLGAAQLQALQASGRRDEEARAQASWRAHGQLARALGEHRQLSWARRREAWEVMNGPSVAPLVTLEMENGDRSLAELATRLLDATDDAAEAFIAPGFAGFVRAALATQASDGWPARLVPATILQLLVGRELVRGLSLGPVPLPQRIAPTSFLRGSVAFGDAFRRAAVPSELPFVVACTVDGFSAKELGHRLAVWMTTEAFGRRRLGLGSSAAFLVSRQLRTALLAEARLAAVRFLLAGALETDARELGPIYGRLFERVFQDDGMTALGRFAVRHDEKTRFAALLAAVAREGEARERWDEDWLDNPRAREALRDDAARPMETSVGAKELERGLDEIARRTHA